MKKKRPSIFSIILTVGLVFLLFNIITGFLNKPKEIGVEELIEKINEGEVANVSVTPKNGVYQVSGILISKEEGNTIRNDEQQIKNKEKKEEQTAAEISFLKHNLPIGMSQETLKQEIAKLESQVKKQASFGANLLAGLENRPTISGENFVSIAIGQEYQIKAITEALNANKINYSVYPYKAPINWLGLIMQIGMFVFLGIFIFNMLKGGAPGVKNAEYTPKVPNVRFSDVIGYDEEKQELSELVDFLKNPNKYRQMGAKLPRGVLLEGPPGTGKTLMAKAVAGESNVPFFAASGSDFEEMYVGLGASRIRKLFKEARKNAPAIIFIDEIDAVGKRSVSQNANPAQNQTINSLLVEMDGFESDQANVIVIAATNKKDSLDDALLRPGRFDRQVLVDLPPVKTREQILRFHLRNKKISEHIDFASLARSTTGMSGAQLSAVANEGALLAVRENKQIIDQEMLQESIDRVLMGPAKITNKYSHKDKMVVSYHESGHCIVGLTLEGAMEVQKITIIPRRDAGGYVSYIPSEEEERFTTEKQLLDRLTSLVAGRCSEKLFLGEVTIGAYNDFEQATKIARAMVTKYGLSRLGVCQFELAEATDPYAQKQYSDSTADKIDQEINRLLNNAIEQAMGILKDRAEDIHLLAKTIREREVLDKEQIDYLMKHRHLPDDNDDVYVANQNQVSTSTNTTNDSKDKNSDVNNFM